PQFVFRLYFLMLDRQRSIVSGHLSVMLSGNWVTRPFRTFFKHASAFNKVLGCGQLAPPCGESNELQSMRPRFCSRSEKIPACVQRCAAGILNYPRNQQPRQFTLTGFFFAGYESVFRSDSAALCSAAVFRRLPPPTGPV